MADTTCEMTTDLSLNRLATNRSSALSGVVGLVDCRMQGPKTFETLLELGRKPVIGFYLRRKEGIPTAVLGLVENPEECSTRGL